MFELHKLGWNGFQHLCLTILREILGQTVQSYLDTKDAGKDGAFTGIWQQTDNSDLKGKFVFQCKFTARRDYNLSITDLRDEIKKAKKLADKGECDCYILLTNAGISGELDSKIKESLKLIGISQYRSFGNNWLNQQIQENKKLRMLVPRVYGLGDLSQILDARAYDQAKAVLESVKDELSKVVMTGAYHKSAEALNDHGFVLIIGEAAAGKTTIATLLAMGALDNWGAETIKVAEADKMIERWNVHEKQFFWIDDAFGVTQYEKPLATQWNHALQQVKAMIKGGSKIVLTSRDYIYASARRDLKESAFPLLLESKVVIDVHALTNDERKQILYNHVKLGRQTQEFKKHIKPLLESASNLPKFVPESARRISDPAFTKNLSLTEYGVGQFIEHPKEMLLDILQGLHKDQLAALALIYMRNDKLESPVAANKPEVEAIERIGSNQGACLEALVDMKGSLVQLLNIETGNIWKFKHPTIGDAFADLLISNVELIGIYLQGSKIESLFNQITCGNVGVTGAVIVPESLFPVIVDRLSSYTRAANFKNESYAIFNARWSSDRFLASRCSKNFLLQYIQRNPDLISRLEKPELYLEYRPYVSLAVTLIRDGLFPEESRRKFVETIIGYTVGGYDFYLLQNEELMGTLTVEEKERLFENIKGSFVTNIEVIRQRWESERNMEDTAEEYLEPFTSTMVLLKDHFNDMPDVQVVFSAQLTKAEQWIADQAGPPVERQPRDKYENLQQSQNFEIKRSIFDDVDQ